MPPLYATLTLMEQSSVNVNVDLDRRRTYFINLLIYLIYLRYLWKMAKWKIGMSMDMDMGYGHGITYGDRICWSTEGKVGR